MDVDGVLKVWGVTSREKKRRVYYEGWIYPRLIPGDSWRALLNPRTGGWLRTLARDTGSQLAWASKWEEDANFYIGPKVGLPKMEVLPAACPDGDEDFKADLVVPATCGRPFVWFDDEAKEIRRARELAGDRCLMIHVNERDGLEEQHIHQAREWLAALKTAGRTVTEGT